MEASVAKAFYSRFGSRLLGAADGDGKYPSYTGVAGARAAFCRREFVEPAVLIVR